MSEAGRSYEQEKQELEEVILRAERYLENVPEGSLRIAKNKNTIQYYWMHSKAPKQGQYLKKSQKDLVVQLAQKDYAQKVLRLAKKKEVKLQEYCKKFDIEEIVKLHETLSIQRQALITPFWQSDEDYAKMWEKQCLYRKQCSPLLGYILNEENGILTERGELVRSKSEKILADKLYAMGVPYVYEMPLYLNGNVVVYPDFTVLNKKERREYYWEHLGMLDIPEYADKNVKKIETYNRNQIYQGRSLLTTYETSKRSLNVKVIEGIIKEFLL